MSVISDGAVKFGKVTVDKETGRTKIAQQVNGVDIGTTIDEIKKAKLSLTDIQQDKIDANTKAISALSEFQKKLLTLNLSASKLSNRIGWNKDRVESVFNQKAVTANTNSYATFIANSKANTSNHTLKVSQLAKYDSYKTTIAAPLTSSDLNLTGSIKIGTGSPDTLKQIDITPTQSLSDIVSSINNWSAETGVTAEVALVSSGVPNNTYQLRLSAKDTGTPIILEDVTGTILSDWNLIRGKELSFQSGTISGSNTSTPLTLTGNLRVQTQGGGSTEAIIDLTGLSLDGIKSALDAAEATSHIHAEIIPIYDPNGSSTSLPIGHQLKLTSTDGQPAVISNSDYSALDGLKLKSFIYNSFNASISTANVNVDQGVTGNLRIKAGSGIEVGIPTAGKSLQQIADEINTHTASGIAARLQLVTPANPTVAGSKSIYQLTIYATNPNTPVTISNSDPTVITGLNLNKPTTDYQSIISKINIDGTDYQRKTNSITDALTGVTINLIATNLPGVETNFAVNENHDATVLAVGDFIDAYNDLITFYNKQTAVKYDPGAKTLKPGEDADLWENQYVKEFMTNFKRTLNTAVHVNEDGLTKVMTLDSLGLDLKQSIDLEDPENGVLIMKNEEKYLASFDERFDAITQYFGNKVSNTNSDFVIKESPFVFPANLRGKDIIVDVQRTGATTYTATATVNGTAHTLDVTLSDPAATDPVLTLKGQAGTALSGIVFSYSGIIANPGSAGTTINIKPGIMADMDGLILKTTDANKNPNTQLKAPFDVMGELLQEIGVLGNKNTKLSEEIANKKEEIEKEMEAMERKFDRVYEAQSKYKEVQMMLSSWMKSNE